MLTSTNSTAATLATSTAPAPVVANSTAPVVANSAASNAAATVAQGATKAAKAASTKAQGKAQGAAAKAGQGGSHTPKQAAAAAAAVWVASPARTGAVKVPAGQPQHMAAFTRLPVPAATATVTSTPHYRATKGGHAAACAAYTAWHAATPGAQRTLAALLAHKPFTAAGGNVAFVQWRAAQGMLVLV